MLARLERLRRPAPAVLLAVSLLPILCAVERPSLNLTSVRFTSEGPATKVVMELSGKFEFETDKIENPDRLFFDFAGTKPKTAKFLVAVRDSQLRQIRIGESKPGVTRVVFDLEALTNYKTSVLKNPHRLVVELTSGPAKPDTSRGYPGKELDTPAPAQQLKARKYNRPLVPPAAFYETRTVTPGKVDFSPPPTLTFVSSAMDWKKARPLDMAKLPPYKAPNKTVARTAPAEPASLAGLPTTGVKKSATVPDSLTRALGLKIRRIVIDPGHGGHDQGSSGPTGLLEKELVLDVSRRLGTLIESQMGSEVIYTREDDRYVALEERPRVANQAKGDLFLSIHANSSVYRAATGVETYYLSFTTSKEALEVAARENASSEHSVSELKDLLQKIAFKDKVDESREFAARLLGTLIKANSGPASSPQARNRGVKRAPFVVLIGANMPSVLAEIGFISNPKDEQLMKKPEQRQKMAEALLRGLMQYAEALGHLQVAKTTTTKTE